MTTRTWLHRAMWVATAVATGLLISQFRGGDTQYVLARTPSAKAGGGVGMLDRFEGGAICVAGGLEERELVAFLDGRSNQLRVLLVNRRRGRVESYMERDLGRDFSVKGRAGKSTFVMLMGNRYDGQTNVYVFETRTGQLKTYLIDSKGRGRLQPAWEEQMTRGIKERDK